MVLKLQDCAAAKPDGGAREPAVTALAVSDVAAVNTAPAAGKVNGTPTRTRARAQPSTRARLTGVRLRPVRSIAPFPVAARVRGPWGFRRAVPELERTEEVSGGERVVVATATGGGAAAAGGPGLRPAAGIPAARGAGRLLGGGRRRNRAGEGQDDGVAVRHRRHGGGDGGSRYDRGGGRAATAGGTAAGRGGDHTGGEDDEGGGDVAAHAPVIGSARNRRNRAGQIPAGTGEAAGDESSGGFLWGWSGG